MPSSHGAEPPPHRQILVADDDVEMRALITIALRRDGNDVEECEDGQALVDAIGVGGLPPPDLVISDVHMPRMTGLSALAWIRRAKPLIPVILITAFGGLEAHREGERLGAAAVLDKPFKFATLLDVVHRVLGRG